MYGIDYADRAKPAQPVKVKPGRESAVSGSSNLYFVLSRAAETTNRVPDSRKRRECSGRDWVRSSTGRHSPEP